MTLAPHVKAQSRLFPRGHRRGADFVILCVFISASKAVTLRRAHSAKTAENPWLKGTLKCVWSSTFVLEMGK